MNYYLLLVLQNNGKWEHLMGSSSYENCVHERGQYLAGEKGDYLVLVSSSFKVVEVQCTWDTTAEYYRVVNAELDALQVQQDWLAQYRPALKDETLEPDIKALLIRQCKDFENCLDELAHEGEPGALEQRDELRKVLALAEASEDRDHLAEKEDAEARKTAADAVQAMYKK